MKYCPRCDDTRFVCEAHPDRPWIDSARGCTCGAPGEPCPLCNQADMDAMPALPDDFVVDVARDVAVDPLLETELEPSDRDDDPAARAGRERKTRH